MEQLTIFSMYENKEIFWDSDIKYIYMQLKKLFEKYNFRINKPKFEVWEHYPQGGYRLDLTCEITKKFFSDVFQEQLENIIKWAKEHKIKLDICGEHIFQDGKNGRVFIFSRFLDKRKNKRF